MPKWKTEPGAQFVALQRLVAAKEKRLKKLEEPSRQEELIVHGRTVRYPLVLKQRPREKWLADQISQRASENGVSFGSTNTSDDDFLAVVKASRPDRHRYLPRGLAAEGMAAYEFRLACEEEGIPRAQRPELKIPLPDTCARMKGSALPPLPDFDLLLDTDETWRDRVGDGRPLSPKVFRKCCDDFLTKIHRRRAWLANMGLLVKQKEPRGSEAATQNALPNRKRKPPALPALRRKWAVLHYCRGRSYGELYLQSNPGKLYTEAAITRAVQRTLEEVGLRDTPPSHRQRKLSN